MILFFSALMSFSFAGVQSLGAAPTKIHEKGAVINFLAHPKIHKNKNAFIGRLEIPASGQVPLHRDTTEEYLYIMEGGGQLEIDGKKHQVHAGDLVFMPAGAQVSFTNGPDKLIALQVFAGVGPEKKYDDQAWKSAPGVNSKEKAARN